MVYKKYQFWEKSTKNTNLFPKNTKFEPKIPKVLSNMFKNLFAGIDSGLDSELFSSGSFSDSFRQTIIVSLRAFNISQFSLRVEFIFSNIEIKLVIRGWLYWNFSIFLLFLCERLYFVDFQIELLLVDGKVEAAAYNGSKGVTSGR